MLLRDARLTAGEIAAHFEISRPATSRHLRVLRDSGLVVDQAAGRQRIYALDTAPLVELVEWIAQFETSRTWEHHLDALETEVYRTRRERDTENLGTLRKGHMA